MDGVQQDVFVAAVIVLAVGAEDDGWRAQPCAQVVEVADAGEVGDGGFLAGDLADGLQQETVMGSSCGTV